MITHFVIGTIGELGERVQHKQQLGGRGGLSAFSGFNQKNRGRACESVPSQDLFTLVSYLLLKGWII